MARPDSLTVVPTKPVVIELAGFSPHVFRYKMWLKPVDAPDWAFLAKGTTADAIPDQVTIAAALPGTRLQCWLGIGGNKNAPFRLEFRVEQDGQLVPNGDWDETGSLEGKSVTAKAWILAFV